MSDLVRISLTPKQARILFNIVDGAADAGACKDGNTAEEAVALNEITDKLLSHHAKWKHVKLEPG